MVKTIAICMVMACLLGPAAYVAYGVPGSPYHGCGPVIAWCWSWKKVCEYRAQKAYYRCVKYLYNEEVQCEAIHERQKYVCQMEYESCRGNC